MRSDPRKARAIGTILAPFRGVMYTCTYHPELTATSFGECPTCGHDLVAAAETGGRGLTCPMHPSVTQHVPGKCPVCDQELVPR